MREILFRGKRLDSGEWVQGAFIPDYTQNAFYITKVGECCHKVALETVGQYIGITDKNGRKIFEGDIFKFNDEVWESYYTSCGMEYDSWEVENYGAIGFYEETAKFDFRKYKFNENSVEADLHENNTIEFADFISELEIVGNIHDNPELLEGGTEHG